MFGASYSVNICLVIQTKLDPSLPPYTHFYQSTDGPIYCWNLLALITVYNRMCLRTRGDGESVTLNMQAVRSLNEQREH
jgi:hypothetical protein